MSSTSQERRHARIREEILESASRAFARKGFHGTSVDEVAREAGLSPSSLYRYFGGKEDLYRALVDRIAEIILAPFCDPLLPTLPFRQRSSGWSAGSWPSSGSSVSSSSPVPRAGVDGLAGWPAPRIPWGRLWPAGLRRFASS